MYITIDKDKEIFKLLTFPKIKQNTYMLSNYGRIYNIKTNKMYKPRIDNDGYLRIRLQSNIPNKTYYIGIHKLVAYEFCSGYDENTKRIIPNHLDGIRDHNYYENISWSTSSENAIHGYTHNGRKGRRWGENNFTKYTEEQVRESCRLRELNYSARQIESITGIQHNYLWEIFSGKKWKGISIDYKLKPPRIKSFEGFETKVQLNILQLLSDGYNAKNICKVLKIDPIKEHINGINNLRKKLNKQGSTTIENDEYYTIYIH